MHSPIETTEHLQFELDKVLQGEPWYGRSVYDIIDEVSFETAYEKPGNGAHTIAEIIIHLLAWTEETIDRLNGKTASLPARGDWPDPCAPDEHKWQQLISSFKLAHTDLTQGIADFPANRWDEPINDLRPGQPVVSFEGAVYGTIQHLIYHAGQIALITKMLQ